MQLDVNRLWEPPVVEEEFVKYVLQQVLMWNKIYSSGSLL